MRGQTQNDAGGSKGGNGQMLPPIILRQLRQLLVRWQTGPCAEQTNRGHGILAVIE